jgi:DMSO reductase anchor subunit
MALSTFQSFKHELGTMVGLSKDALHVYFGLAAFLLAAAVVRQGLRSWIPLLLALAMAVAGELLDARDNFRTYGQWRVGASVHDIINTMFWPLALWLLARYSRVMN